MKGILLVKAHRCVSCKTCELACAIAHSKSRDLYGAISEDPAPVSRVAVEPGSGFGIPLQCRQCEDAQCVKICPKEALSRTDAESPVVVDDDKCTRCMFCVVACPYGLISLDKASNTIIKCDQCLDRLQSDELPACVTACPTGALGFERLEEVSAGEREGFLVKIGRE